MYEHEAKAIGIKKRLSAALRSRERKGFEKNTALTYLLTVSRAIDPQHAHTLNSFY